LPTQRSLLNVFLLRKLVMAYECNKCKKVHEFISSVRLVSILKGPVIETVYECPEHSDIALHCIGNDHCQCGQTWDCAVYNGTVHEQLRGLSITL
jgi:hypothetical protein